MPGRRIGAPAGLSMLLWISAAGLAGAGWFGWLVYRDYDWSNVRSSVSSRSMPFTKAYTDTYQEDSQAVAIDENDLLGQTNTRWDGVHDLTSLGLAGHIHEDFVVVDPSLPAQPESQGLDFDINPSTEPKEVQPNAAHEDFVVVQAEIGISPFLATTDEDFVVVPDSDQEAESAELPEVDLTDYVNSWTPIVPKIAALISHELWPQLRSYLESLPQFGDTNLERVVNAVAEDVGVGAANADGVGERATEGFAFYASLFDEMAHESELAEV